MPIKIKSAGGGSITLDVPSTAVDTTLFLPTSNGAAIYSNTNTAFSGNVAISGASSYLSINGDNVSPYAMRNIIINGGMDVWQRATSQTVTGYGCADRWYNLSSSSTTTISQDTSVPTGVPVQYSLKWLTGAATTYGQSFQAIERANVIRLRGQKVTLSCYVKTLNWTGNILLRSMYSNSSDAQATVIAGTGISDGYAAGSTMTSWTRLTNTFTVPADAVGLGVYILPDTVQTASGAAVWITGVQLELGTVATPFENRPFGTEFALCQRYYQKTFDQATVPGSWSRNTGQGIGQCHNSGFFRLQHRFVVPMRSAPTVTPYDSAGSSGKVDYYTSGSWNNGGTLSYGFNTNQGGFWTGHDIASSIETQFAYTAAIEL